MRRCGNYKAILMMGMMATMLMVGKPVHAKENEAPSLEQYATAEQLQTLFDLDDDDTDGATNVGRIKFGRYVNGNQDGEWLIAGTDSNYKDSLAILSADSIGGIPFDSTSSIFGDDKSYPTIESNILKKLREQVQDDSYFTYLERKKLVNTTLETKDSEGKNRKVTCKIYPPDSIDKSNFDVLNIGSTNNIEIAQSKLTLENGFQLYKSNFWLRSPKSGEANAVAWREGNGEIGSMSVNVYLPTIVAANLDMSEALFASKVSAVNASNAVAIDDAYTVRFKSTDSAQVQINKDESKATVWHSAPGMYLVVQTKDGACAKKKLINTLSFDVKDFEINGQSLENFKNCKIWIEETMFGITTASEAKRGVETSVLIHNGKASGVCAKGTTVHATADDPAEGKQFKAWKVIKGNVELEDATKTFTRFVMPDEDVEIEAIYEDIPTEATTETTTATTETTTATAEATKPESSSKISVSKTKVAKIKSTIYTGYEKKPSPKVTYSGKILKKGTDYTISYKNNTKTGTAKVIIKGKGTYTGTKSVTFKIKKRTKIAKGIYVVKAKHLKGHKSPGKNRKVITYYKKGDKLTVIKVGKKVGKYSWVKVKQNKKTSYVYSKYLAI